MYFYKLSVVDNIATTQRGRGLDDPRKQKRFPEISRILASLRTKGLCGSGMTMYENELRLLLLKNAKDCTSKRPDGS